MNDNLNKTKQNKATTRIIKLRNKIRNKYPELMSPTSLSIGKDVEIKTMSFAEQVRIMSEIENMKTQKVTQWVLIILAICNLFLIGLQIYLQFFK